MASLHIELIESEPGNFTVIVGGLFADMLCRDEALGAIAAALFAGQTRLPYLKTYAEWDVWNRKYRADNHQTPAALLSWNGRAH